MKQPGDLSVLPYEACPVKANPTQLKCVFLSQHYQGDSEQLRKSRLYIILSPDSISMTSCLVWTNLLLIRALTDGSLVSHFFKNIWNQVDWGFNVTKQTERNQELDHVRPHARLPAKKKKMLFLSLPYKVKSICRAKPPNWQHFFFWPKWRWNYSQGKFPTERARSQNIHHVIIGWEDKIWHWLHRTLLFRVL